MILHTHTRTYYIEFRLIRRRAPFTKTIFIIIIIIVFVLSPAAAADALLLYTYNIRNTLGGLFRWRQRATRLLQKYVKTQYDNESESEII